MPYCVVTVCTCFTRVRYTAPYRIHTLKLLLIIAWKRAITMSIRLHKLHKVDNVEARGWRRADCFTVIPSVLALQEAVLIHCCTAYTNGWIWLEHIYEVYCQKGRRHPWPNGKRLMWRGDPGWRHHAARDFPSIIIFWTSHNFPEKKVTVKKNCGGLFYFYLPISQKFLLQEVDNRRTEISQVSPCNWNFSGISLQLKFLRYLLLQSVSVDLVDQYFIGKLKPPDISFSKSWPMEKKTADGSLPWVKLFPIARFWGLG